jgi:toxin-antitoxin system PIN domain toxin
VRIVDANVLIYAVNSAADHHRSAVQWLDDALNARESVGFSWTVLLAFIRITTHPAIFPSPLSAQEAVAVVRAWLAQPSSVIVEPTPRHVDVLAGLLAEAGTAANLVNDAHLAALALEHDAVVVSYDSDFGRFAGLRREVPAA